MRRPFRLLLMILSLLPGLLLGQVDSTAAGSESPAKNVRPLSVLNTRYRLRAGEPANIDVQPETLDFLLHAKTRRVEIAGKEARGIVLAPNRAGDRILLAASLAMKPGEYAVTVSAVSRTGEERAATVDVTLDPLQSVPSNSTVPPVVLLNGLQLPSKLAEWATFDTCPVSIPSDAFGSLETQLTTSQSLSARNPKYPGIDGAGVPVVYFFDNCVEDPNGLIENLGNVLGDVLNLIRYDNGALVPQVDLVSHSMGGLIVRAYLSGLQTNGTLSPPVNPRVRKLIEIATPNFGSFLAQNWSYLIPNGTQTAEMIPGSTFLWYLATWNQRGDDLRGVDGLAIIGNSGYWQSSILSASSPNLSDGVVSITSASLGFVPLSYARNSSRTIILPYCHTSPPSPIDCSGGGIANVDQAPETGAIVLSFLENTSAWESIGVPNQTEFGGVYFALENAAGTQYTALESVSLGSQPLQGGANAAFFYNEFATQAGTLEATSTASQATNCGSFSAPGGYYSAVRCKYNPLIYSVQSSLSTGLPGLTVASGSTITISGAGFSSSTGTALLADGTPLSGQVVSDQEITAFLPSSYSGLVSLTVSNSAGQDAINIVAAPPSLPPTISLSPTHLQFSYTAGGASPAAQTETVANSGGGTLTWSATTSASWLSAAPTSGTAPSTLSVLVSPTSLNAGTYTGSVQILAAGASNSPVSVAITLTVAPAAAVLAVSPQALTFNYAVGGAAPATQGISIANTGGALNWSATSSASWLSVTPASGTAPSTPSVRVSPTGLSAGTYTGDVQISASGSPNSSVPVTVTLTVAPAAAVLAISPQALTFNYAMGSATPAAQSVSINNSGGGTLAWTASSSASWLTVSPATGSTSSTLSVSMNPVGLIAGALSGAITISSPGIASQTLSVALTVTGAPLTPAIVSVVNAASFLPGFAPIGWVTITGKNLSVTSRTWTSSDIVNGQLPTSLDGVSVSINNHPAFVYYISPGQLNVQAPSDSLAADQNVQVTVTTPNGSASATALERRIGPAMFMSDATHVAAIHSDGTLVGPVGFIPGAASRPASPGETILLYMTGLGSDTSPVIPAGQIVTSPASMTDPINVMIGGQAAIVQYAGLVSPGLYQLNIVVPAVANGDQTATVQVAGVASENSGLVTVQQ
jgi:uncharacterized protein (TIGR03437 family)